MRTSSTTTCGGASRWSGRSGWRLGEARVRSWIVGLYEDIRDHAPNETYTSAGDLHEALWIALLRAETPDLHNVRLARGDGGLDGYRFIDPSLGVAHVYQAKFWTKLEDGQKETLVDEFLKAHAHKFRCAKWTFLTAFRFSAPEVNWFSSDLKAGAKAKSKAELHTAIDACEIMYKDSDDLADLARRHLVVTARFLPESTSALKAELETAKSERAGLLADLQVRLQVVQEGLIRDRQAESRRAIASLKMLNQGWANHITALSLWPAGLSQRGRRGMEVADLVAFAEQRMALALAAEGLVAGVSELVQTIHYHARVLQQVLVFESADAADEEGVLAACTTVVEAMRELSGRVGDVLLFLQRAGAL